MLVDDIKAKVKAAMKAGDTVTKEVLRVALGEIQTAEARNGKDATEDEAAAVVRKLVKSNRETLEASNDAEQKATLEEEIEVLQALLPKALDVGEIVAALTPVLDQVKAAGNDGQATGVAMKHLKGGGASVNGKDVAQAVKKIRA